MPFLKSITTFFSGKNAKMVAEKSPQAQKHDFETLLGAVLPFAEQMLAKHGEFYPYGATMKPNGNIASVGGYTGDERPKYIEVIGLIKAAYKHDAAEHKIMASALVYDMRITPPGKTEKTDALAIDLDHRDGLSITMFYAYKIGANKVVSFEEPIAQKGKGEVFAAVPRVNKS